MKYFFPQRPKKTKFQIFSHIFTKNSLLSEFEIPSGFYPYYGISQDFFFWKFSLSIFLEVSHFHQLPSRSSRPRFTQSRMLQEISPGSLLKHYTGYRYSFSKVIPGIPFKNFFFFNPEKLPVRISLANTSGIFKTSQQYQKVVLPRNTILGSNQKKPRSSSSWLKCLEFPSTFHVSGNIIFPINH